jgi:hypothetical protein
MTGSVSNVEAVRANRRHGGLSVLVSGCVNACPRGLISAYGFSTMTNADRPRSSWSLAFLTVLALALLSIGALTWYAGGSSTVALDAAGLGILVAAMAMMATAIRQH